MLDQGAAVALALLARPRAEVDEVVTLAVAGAEHVALGVVEQGQELGEEALAALSRQLVVHSPQAAAEERAPIFDVAAGREPGGEVCEP